MRILLFTVVNCKGCDAHRRELVSIARDLNVTLNVYNIDDPRYFSVSLRAMKQYGIRKTPSIVLLSEDGTIITVLQGIHDTLEKLNLAIHEKRRAG